MDRNSEAGGARRQMRCTHCTRSQHVSADGPEKQVVTGRGPGLLTAVRLRKWKQIRRTATQPEAARLLTPDNARDKRSAVTYLGYFKVTVPHWLARK